MMRQSRSVRTVGEGEKKGRISGSVKSLHSTSAWTEEVIVRCLRLWTRISKVSVALIAMLSLWRRALLSALFLCAITILYEMVVIDPS